MLPVAGCHGADIVISVCAIVILDTMAVCRTTFLWNNSTICYHNSSTMTGSMHDPLVGILFELLRTVISSGNKLNRFFIGFMTF